MLRSCRCHWQAQTNIELNLIINGTVEFFKSVDFWRTQQKLLSFSHSHCLCVSHPHAIIYLLFDVSAIRMENKRRRRLQRVTTNDSVTASAPYTKVRRKQQRLPKAIFGWCRHWCNKCERVPFVCTWFACMGTMARASDNFFFFFFFYGMSFVCYITNHEPNRNELCARCNTAIPQHSRSSSSSGGGSSIRSTDNVRWDTGKRLRFFLRRLLLLRLCLTVDGGGVARVVVMVMVTVVLLLAMVEFHFYPYNL